MEAMTFLLGALATSFGLIFIILTLQFNSVGKTVIVSAKYSWGLIGVLLGVTLSGMTMSIVMTGIGIMTFAGVVVARSSAPARA